MIHIVTDSTCEAPPEVLSHPAVHVVPLSILFGKQVLRDGVDITHAEFWERLPKADPLPTTSQAALADFLALFQSYTDAGDEVVVLLISSKLSGTCDSALQACELLPGRPISVVDSLSVSVGLGIMVQTALEMALAGATRAQVVARMLDMRDAVHILFSVDTLEYLYRGGRIGKAQAMLGTLLKFKPLLRINDGQVEPVGRARSHSKALDGMLEQLGHEISARGPQVRIAVTQAGVSDEALTVAQRLAEEFRTPQVYTSTLGPVLGVHVGPGTIGAAVYPGVGH